MLFYGMSSISMTSALYPVHEVFASIQGEGVFVGEPQIFVRLEGCPLRCAWCDTPRTWKLPDADALIADSERLGQRAWVAAREIANWVEALDPGGTRTVSVTGGEPLMWPDAILELRALMPQRRLHLETAGAFPESLARVLDAVDHVSADLKLPADLNAPVPLGQAPGAPFETAPFETAPTNAAEWREERRAVLRLIAERDACLKVVIAGERAAAEFEHLLRDAFDLARRLPLILQPASAMRAVTAPSEALVQGVAQLATSLGLKVRILPQVHVLLGLR